MIARITGKILEKGQNYVILEVGGVSYEILIPTIVMAHLKPQLFTGNILTLTTYHYFQVEPSKGIPILIGFSNEIEKEFFETFITVSGIGPKAALRALNQPISLISRAIDEGDINFLKSLPGIGHQRAREIIAKLQNKVGKFGLIKDTFAEEKTQKTKDIAEDAIAILVQLQYKKAEATIMVKKALERCPEVESTEELLNQIYKEYRLR